MKRPERFNPNKYQMLKEESIRIAGCLLKQWTRPRDNRRFLSEKINDTVAFLMNGDDGFTLLNFFQCKGIYISNRYEEHGLFVTVRSDFCDSGILRQVSKVKPKRVKNNSANESGRK